MAGYQQWGAWGCQQAWPLAPQPTMINSAYFGDSDSDEESEVEAAVHVEKGLKVASVGEPSGSAAQQEMAEPAVEPPPATATPDVHVDVATAAVLPSPATSEAGNGASDSGSEPDAELDAPPAAPPVRAKSADEPEAEVTPEAPQPKAAPPTAWSARMSQQRHRIESPTWAQAETKPMLQSPTAWAARHRKVEDEDTRVARTVKSLLNKLTVEKFPQLYDQLLTCGIRTTGHVQTLIQEVFEKATTQHHFIDMYADLCSLLDEHFLSAPISEDPKFNFKRLLLNECQSSFERHLTPPEDIKRIEDFDERSIAEHKYKTRMLGTIRFVGALVVRKMLVAKVMLAICAELLSDPTPEALESLAALLTVVGPKFDQDTFAGRAQLTGIFGKMEDIVHSPTCESRARCLLQDVLDLRADGWRERRPKRAEGPMKLAEVAQLAAVEQPWACTWSVSAPRQATAMFDRSAFRTLLLELRCSRDEGAAAERLAQSPPPPVAMQATEVAFMWSEVAREAAPVVRRVAFGLVAKLFFKGLTSTGACWDARALVDGARHFARGGLQAEVPALPEIVMRELVPTLKPLKVGGLIPESSIVSLMALAA
mmetsp:Transcript_115281/g.322222  ORF Transcript_115281/g.322222 Transcript_115281/m.322222 type:complete len:596 (+) Transcript_115281:180-1967(+)